MTGNRPGTLRRTRRQQVVSWILSWRWQDWRAVGTVQPQVDRARRAARTGLELIDHDAGTAIAFHGDRQIARPAEVQGHNVDRLRCKLKVTRIGGRGAAGEGPGQEHAQAGEERALRVVRGTLEGDKRATDHERVANDALGAA